MTAHPLDALWLIRVKGEVFGPYTGHRIAAYVADGRVTSATDVSPAGVDQWRPAEVDPILGPLFTQPRPPDPPRAEAKPDASESFIFGAEPPRESTRAWVNPFQNGWATPLAAIHIAYILYALGVLLCFPFVIGLALLYNKRKEAKEAWLFTHYMWLIRTFWIGVALWAITIPLMFIWIGFLIAPAIYGWAIWRLARGWLLLAERKEIPDPEGWIGLW